MAKRNTGVGAKRQQLKSPHKTKKRLAAKREMIAIRKAKSDKKK